MDDVWDNSSRFEAINIALDQIPHNQTAMGMGFRLSHNPTTCRKCRATISVLELASIIKMLEGQEEVSSEGVEILDT